MTTKTEEGRKKEEADRKTKERKNPLDMYDWNER
jgi:hypothetical protein